MSSRRQRLHELETVVAQLQAQHGVRAIRKATDAVCWNDPASARLSTSFPQLDLALSTGLDDGYPGEALHNSAWLGGLPQGRISEIMGPATSGKVTLAAKVLASAHASGDTLAAWLDLSHTCDPDYLRQCGVDLDRLLVVRPRDTADALAIMLHLVESNSLVALVFDGLADLDTTAESTLTGTLERLSTLAARSETAVLFLSEPQAQYRTLAHVAAVRLGLSVERWLTRNRDVYGYEVRVQVLKNRTGQSGAIVPIRILLDGEVA